jgi:hypothetical protein
MRRSGRSRGPRAGGRCGRDDSSSGGGWWWLDLSAAATICSYDGIARLRCATRDLENNVCVWGGGTRVRGGWPRRCRPAGGIACARCCLRPLLLRVGGRVSREARRIRRVWWGARSRVPCSGRPRPDAARGPGVVSADSCGPGAAGGPASGGSDSRGGSFSSRPVGPAAPQEGCRFPSFLYGPVLDSSASHIELFLETTL